MTGHEQLHPRLHVRRPPDLRGGRAGQPRRVRERGRARARARERGAVPRRCSSRCATSRSSATCAAPGYFHAIELVKDKDTKESFDDEESETLLRGFLSGELYRRGLICRADDRGDPVIQLSPPLIAGPEQFEEIEEILRAVLTEAGERMHVDGRRPALQRAGARYAAAMLTVRELLQRPRRPPARGRAKPGPPGPLGAHLRAARPDAVAVRRRAAADHRDAARDADAQRGSSWRAWPTTSWPGSGSGPASRTPRCRSRCSRSRPSASSRCSRCPYEVPFIAVTEAAFTQLVNEQYAVAAARARRAGAARADRALRARPRRAGRRAGDADRRGRGRVRRARRAAAAARVPPGDRARGARTRCAARCASGPAGARRGRSCPRWPTANQGLALPVAADGAPRPGAGGPGSGRAPEAWLVAVKDAGRCRTSTG